MVYGLIIYIKNLFTLFDPLVTVSPGLQDFNSAPYNIYKKIWEVLMDYEFIVNGSAYRDQFFR